MGPVRLCSILDMIVNPPPPPKKKQTKKNKQKHQHQHINPLKDTNKKVCNGLSLEANTLNSLGRVARVSKMRNGQKFIWWPRISSMYLYLHIHLHKCSTVLSLAHRLRDHESASETKASVHNELKVARCNTCDCQQAASNKHTPFQSGVCVSVSGMRRRLRISHWASSTWGFGT